MKILRILAICSLTIIFSNNICYCKGKALYITKFNRGKYIKQDKIKIHVPSDKKYYTYGKYQLYRHKPRKQSAIKVYPCPSYDFSYIF